MTYDGDRGVFAGEVVNQHRRHHQRVVVFLAIYHAVRRIVFVACFALVWEYHKNGTTHKGRTINNARKRNMTKQACNARNPPSQHEFFSKVMLPIIVV